MAARPTWKGYLKISLVNIPVKVFHMDDLIQCLVDDIDGAMPRTPPISLHGIHSLLPADKEDTEVATSIVFARLLDFIRYMESDPFDLLQGVANGRETVLKLKFLLWSSLNPFSFHSSGPSAYFYGQ